jgi:hypothetical protein
MTQTQQKFVAFHVRNAWEIMRVRFIMRSLGWLVRRDSFAGEMRGANADFASRKISAVNFDVCGGKLHLVTGSWDFCPGSPPS